MRSPASPAHPLPALPALSPPSAPPTRTARSGPPPPAARCAARHGIHQPVPVHLPVHHKVCTRHGIWLSDAGQPHLDLAACPEIITAQHRASRLLRRYTPQELMLAYQAASTAIPPWPPSPAAIPLHWRHRLLTLQTANHRYGTPTDLDAYTHAAIHPDAIAITAAALNPHPRTIKQDPLANSPGTPHPRQP